MATRCIRCGNDIVGTAQFCDDCGAALKAEEEQFRQSTTPPEQTWQSPAAATPSAPAQPGAPSYCRSCGSPLPAEAGFCGNCGAGVSETAGVEYAGFCMRFVAWIIDGLILGAAQLVVSFAVSDQAAAIGISTLIGLVYAVGFWVSEGATPGKMAMGVKIVSAEGEPLTLGRAIGRYFGYILSGLTLGIGYLMIGWTPQKRGLHDYVAGTVVIKT